jgi:predicted transport protein
MPLLQHIKGQLKLIKEEPYPLEKDMQALVEKNLDALLSLELVCSEFNIKNRRMDTLAFDTESKAFVIIEYKRGKNYSVVDQGMAYLQLMLENKAEFIVEYNERLNGKLKRDDVDWSQSRLIFVAPSFTTDQKASTNFKDLNIGLMEVRRYSGDLFNVIHHTASGSAPSFKEVAPNIKGASKVKQEIYSYTEETHLENVLPTILELYEKLKAGILNLGDGIIVSPKKQVIGFKGQKVFCDVEVQKKALKVVLNLKKGTLTDPKKITEDVSNVGHWGNGDYRAIIADDTELEYLLSLIKVAYKKQA